ncbi:Amino-acid carrier protein AlsT [Blautia producta]|uniref:Amino-acid carrier protein AlsT n=1 Tax=Blautia producta TaxID=33035 RepID=A0A4V0Z807_9FIRM|nr:alanine/glycine:cation symporter family protein [Blautia producta]QBE98638.1 Amino-acid carrier protein AlsT [Blautia producta]
MLNNILTSVNDFMYTYPLLILLVGAGVYFTVRTRFVQGRLLGEAFRVLLEKAEVKDGKKQVSSFQALMISTASRVGTGNIAGIATAIAAGGPGAVFWMWVMAVIGSASAFIESTLAQVYKVKDGKDFRGGPSYYMEKALGKRYLGIIFSILLIICFAYGFNGLQSFNMSSSLEYYIPGYADSIYPAVIGAVLAAATAFVIFGGVHRIGFITSVIVPVMAGGYLIMGLATMVMNAERIPEVFALIFREAFDGRAIFGGFAGSAVVIGIKRGLFSNEAGMGSAPNASASAAVSHPAKQGLVQVLSVFIDTLLICSATAMMLLLSGVEGKSGVLDGIPFVQQAISANVGTWGIHFITFSIFTFAFSSLVGNYYYAESNIKFIKDDKRLLFVFRVSCLLAVFLGAQADFSVIWNVADITMGGMAVLNILVILVLGGTAVKVLRDYEEQKKKGVEPVFRAEKLGIRNTECWDDSRSLK